MIRRACRFGSIPFVYEAAVARTENAAERRFVQRRRAALQDGES